MFALIGSVLAQTRREDIIYYPGPWIVEYRWQAVKTFNFILEFYV